uniref:Uncharacterized protein n=1 Tax=Terrapene triunguis TaxID=2587831 RepID=A0A674JQW7_9SAUR
MGKNRVKSSSVPLIFNESLFWMLSLCYQACCCLPPNVSLFVPVYPLTLLDSYLPTLLLLPTKLHSTQTSLTKSINGLLCL